MLVGPLVTWVPSHVVLAGRSSERKGHENVDHCAHSAHTPSHHDNIHPQRIVNGDETKRLMSILSCFVYIY